MFDTNFGAGKVKELYFELPASIYNFLATTPYPINLPEGNYYLLGAKAQFSNQTIQADCQGFSVETVSNNDRIIEYSAIPPLPINGGCYLNQQGNVAFFPPLQDRFIFVSGTDDLAPGNGSLQVWLFYIRL